MPGYRLIDPPVGPFSTASDIEAWIETLRKMPASPEVHKAIERASSNLKRVLQETTE